MKRFPHFQLLFSAPQRLLGLLTWFGVAASTWVGSVAFASLAEGLKAFENEDYEKARTFLGAEASKPEAQFRLAQMHRYAWGGVENLAEALRLIKLAAEARHREAQAELGRMLLEGRGTDENPNEAARWLRLAAERGSGIAQLNLARCYRVGKGVQRDFVQAYLWFTLAASNGFVDALSNRAVFAERMDKVNIDAAEKLVKEFKVKE